MSASSRQMVQAVLERKWEIKNSYGTYMLDEKDQYAKTPRCPRILTASQGRETRKWSPIY